jgi:membrane-associated phospholipid phosphatase
MAVTAVVSAARPAAAQRADAQWTPCEMSPGPGHLLGATAASLKQLPTRSSLGILSLGAAAAIGAHRVDGNATRTFAGNAGLNGTFGSGAVLGGAPLQMGAAFTALAIGRAFHHPCIARAGFSLLQAQLLAQALTIGLKETSRRARPEGGGFSFPSGHTTMSFASATVLQQQFGWKVGIPAYAVASYVAASRIQTKRHYLSDVTFGAALGIVAGRTVSIGHGRRLLVTPMASPSGAAAGFTLIGKR